MRRAGTPTRGMSLLASLALAGCVTALPDNVSVACARGRPAPIAGEWTLDRIDGVPWRITRATMLAEPTGFAGELACNGYGTAEPVEGGAHYEVERGRLKMLGDIVTTSLYCRDRRLNAFEAEFVDVLYDEPHVARRADGRALCLYTDDGRSLEFRRVESRDAAG